MAGRAGGSFFCLLKSPDPNLNQIIPTCPLPPPSSLKPQASSLSPLSLQAYHGSASARPSPLCLLQLLWLHRQQSSSGYATRYLSLLHQRPVQLLLVRASSGNLPPHLARGLLRQMPAQEAALLSPPLCAQARRLLQGVRQQSCLTLKPLPQAAPRSEAAPPKRKFLSTKDQ